MKWLSQTSICALLLLLDRKLPHFPFLTISIIGYQGSLGHYIARCVISGTQTRLLLRQIVFFSSRCFVNKSLSDYWEAPFLKSTFPLLAMLSAVSIFPIMAVMGTVANAGTAFLTCANWSIAWNVENNGEVRIGRSRSLHESEPRCRCSPTSTSPSTRTSEVLKRANMEYNRGKRGTVIDGVKCFLLDDELAKKESPSLVRSSSSQANVAYSYIPPERKQKNTMQNNNTDDGLYYPHRSCSTIRLLMNALAAVTIAGTAEALNGGSFLMSKYNHLGVNSPLSAEVVEGQYMKSKDSTLLPTTNAVNFLAFSSIWVASGKNVILDSTTLSDIIPPVSSSQPFRSAAYGKQEYTNSLTASRDTNISPAEAYDSIQLDYLSTVPIQQALMDKRTPRALDVGAGAGVSTQILYNMGYKVIDAIDWSADAWNAFVVDNDNGYIPQDVAFYEMDDERYRAMWRTQCYGHDNADTTIISENDREDATSSLARKKQNELFDAIVFNFAVNDDKAKSFAAEMLQSKSGRLLAPVNVQTDYWLKQEYRCYDQEGNVLWRAGEVGAWSVQFQPDVTQDSCQGIWCSPFNGFKKM